MNAALLRRLPLFAGLPEEVTAALGAHARTVTLDRGELLMAEGAAPDAMYVVLDGQLEVVKRSAGQTVRLNVCGTGEPLGELSLLAGRPRSATVRALRPTRLLRIDERAFTELLGEPGAARAILQTVVRRLEGQEATLRHHGKMAALGTMTAGLLHELNNPAAALQRDARRLRELAGAKFALSAWLAVRSPSSLELLERLRAQTPRDGGKPDPLARSDRESELQRLLEERGVEGAWELVGPLAAAGWDTGAVERLAEAVDRPQLLGPTARWLSLAAEEDELLADLAEAAGRISEVVGAVKRYAHVDQAPVQNVDLHDGLESTLRLLRHKLGSGVELVRDYQEGLPAVEGFPGELNQVWTNLLDNALDALGGGGRLTVRTHADADEVLVEVSDDGPGIPADVRERVFEPFYTTKAFGQGSGLGLSVSHQIITERHGGRIAVDSRPGSTTFRVSLPLRLPDRDG